MESGFEALEQQWRWSLNRQRQGSACMHVHLWHRSGTLANPQPPLLHKKDGKRQID
jgi:hypothetical protein